MSSIEGQYAVWTDPESPQTVKYALPLFHELDFQVNEAYRRIPHGGIEIGGVLYGRFDGASTTVEAFRPIECEHASGPSFVLSDKDVARMSERFGEAQSDPELKGLERIGWFVSHTRTAPEMTSRESEIFDRYFSGPGRVTLLIKPERFQPTRFVFSVRKPDGKTPLRDTQHAVILPLPGRASSAVPVQSIPAPDRKEILRRQSSPERPPDPDPSEIQARQSSQEKPTETQPAINPQPAPGTSVLKEAPKLPSEPLPAPESIRQRRSEQLRGSIAQDEWRTEATAKRRANATGKPANMSLALVLVFASLLGCVAGYWAYLQLPPPVISLRVEQLPSAVLVRWPAEQTRGTNLAAIRIDDGQAMPLTEQQKNSGQIQISPTSDNVKIELISHHALRDSRGIIRYLRPETGGAPAAQGQSSTGTPPKPPGEPQ
jgi:hypothetical protein